MTFSLAQLARSFAAQPLLALGGAYAGGVLTSLTPCLCPMIPVTLAIVGGGARREDARAKYAGKVTFVGVGVSSSW